MPKAVAFDPDTGIATAWEDDSGNYIPDQSSLNKTQEADWKESVANQVEGWDPGTADTLRGQAETSREQVKNQIPAWNQMRQTGDYNTFNPWTGEFINEQGQSAGVKDETPAKLDVNYFNGVSVPEDQVPSENLVVGDGGYVIDQNQEQSFGTPNFQLVYQEIEGENKRREKANEMYDYWAAPDQFGYDEQYVGDGGYVFAPTGGPGKADEVARPADEYTGSAALDSIHRDQSGYWTGQKRTVSEMNRPYTDVYTARWYAEQPEFVDPSQRQAMHDYLNQIEANSGTDATPVSKAELAEKFGFMRNTDNPMTVLSNTLSSAADNITDVAGQVAQSRQNSIQYTGTDSQGRKFNMNANSDGEIIDNMQLNYVTPGGNVIDTSAPMSLNGTTLMWGDVPLGDYRELLNVPGYSEMSPEEQNVAIRNVYGINASVTSSLDGQALSEEDIRMLTRDPNVLMQLPSVQRQLGVTYEDYTNMDDDEKERFFNELVSNKDYGTGLDYGLFNWATPQTHRSQGIVDNLTNGNLVNQFADLMLGSAPYMTPFTLAPLGASQVWQAANGVTSMGRDNQNLKTVANTAIAAPAQGLATVGESLLGGMAAGRLGMSTELPGLFESVGRKIAPRFAESTNPLVSIGREGLYEGLEEVATNPLYNLAEQGYTTLDDELKDLPDNLAGGALIGAPMEAINQVRTRR